MPKSTFAQRARDAKAAKAAVLAAAAVADKAASDAFAAGYTPDTSVNAILADNAVRNAQAVLSDAEAAKADMRAKRTAAKAAKAANASDAGKAAAPAPDAPAPADVTQSARAKRLATVATLLATGAHAPNVRSTTSVRIAIGVAKYDFSHLAKLAFAKRIAGLPAGTQAFYHANAKAYAGKPMPADQFDNAKLARVINAGLATYTGGHSDGLHLCGNVSVTFLAASDLPS